ncbi:Amidohydrolase [Pseudoruegeria aquimaris]|uniref:Amidohydrolase n=1 Tax=Pseudoruegeria aquimaris TaxID=393663 RepID=A0A1Y5SRU4_9RHOB|nr:amidohydrolase [Pseudoruegeria aquimaris]SLN47001.1 Amidohydrolase [Pseudoruegeria aquimaris]
MLFDTHLHLIYPERLSYPWLADFAALNRPSTFDAYRVLAGRLGITGCLHMEVDVAESQIAAETDLVEELMASEGSLMRGAISSCRPESEGFAAFLEAARARPAIKGFRRVLHVVDDDLSTTPLFRDNVKRLSGTGLTFDLCVQPRQHGIAAALVDHCPDVTFILDHCGVPDIAGGTFEAWQAGMRALAERPNVVAKISGVVAYGDAERWSLADLRPYVEATAEAFGPERLVWGSDSPVCNLGGGLPTWVAATHALTAGWSAAERTALYAGNARRIWNLQGDE